MCKRDKIRYIHYQNQKLEHKQTNNLLYRNISFDV